MADLEKVYWSYVIRNVTKNQIISDAIPVSVDFSYGIEAGLAELSLPRTHDTPNTMVVDAISQTNDMGDEISISVNETVIFVGIIRAIYPTLTGTDQRVNLSVVDYRVRMNEKVVEKDGSTIIIWNEKGVGTDTVKDIIEYIFDNGYVNSVSLPQSTRDSLPDVNMGQISFQEMNAGDAINYVLGKAGTWKWWVNADKEFKVYELKTGTTETVEVGFDVVDHNLRKSIAEVVNDVWVIGAKKQYQLIREPLEPAWDRTLESTYIPPVYKSIWDTKNEDYDPAPYVEVGRKWKAKNKKWLQSLLTTHEEDGEDVNDAFTFHQEMWDFRQWWNVMKGYTDLISGAKWRYRQPIITYIDYDNGIVYTAYPIISSTAVDAARYVDIYSALPYAHENKLDDPYYIHDLSFYGFESSYAYSTLYSAKTKILVKFGNVYATYAYEAEDLIYKTGQQGNAPFAVTKAIDRRSTFSYKEISGKAADIVLPLTELTRAGYGRIEREIIRVPATSPYEVDLDYRPQTDSVEVWQFWPNLTTQITDVQVDYVNKKLIFASEHARKCYYLYYDIDQIILRDDSEPGGKMESVAEAEILKRKDIEVSGAVTVIGDIKWGMGKRLNIISDTNEYANIDAEIIKVTHTFDNGFLTSLQLNREEFIPGEKTEEEIEEEEAFKLDYVGPQFSARGTTPFYGLPSKKKKEDEDEEGRDNVDPETSLPVHEHSSNPTGGELSKDGTKITGDGHTGTLNGVIEWDGSKWVASGGRWVPYP